MPLGRRRGLGLMTAAGTDHPAECAADQHRRTWTQEGQPRHGQADAAAATTAIEGSAIGAQQRATGTVDDPFGTAERHHAVLADRPVQQQLPGADPLQLQARLQLPAGVQGRGLTRERQNHLRAGQQPAQKPGRRPGAAVRPAHHRSAG